MSQRPKISFRSLRSFRGFSLLELMIVLVVIVGLLALAWPNLQRPLKRAELNQATQQLREAIDESRYQAISTGTPVFIRLKLGESEVLAGGFETFASADSAMISGITDQDLSSSSSQQMPNELQESENAALKIWKLPDNIVISDVAWSDGLEAEEDEWEFADSSDNALVQGADSSEATGSSVTTAAGKHSRAEVEHSSEAFDLLGESEQVWWLPVSSLNQGRDVEITLWDKDSHESMRVHLSSATGELEIHR